MANYGRHDPVSGLPLRVLDFLKSLDVIVDTAIVEKVDLVLFAGDAYKDRSPAPTFQREWGRRIIRLSQAGIPALLLIGNHDLSPAAGRANAIHEYDTLQVPYVRVLSELQLLSPHDLWDLPIQVISLPWLSRSSFMANNEFNAGEVKDVYTAMESWVVENANALIGQADASLPLILLAHASVQGAQYGSERTVMLGSDMVIPGSLVKDPRLDYVALGHIHKAQDLNQGSYPPVVYPGSIERVDFGEARDDKFFVLVDVERGNARVEWRKLGGVRPFIDRRVVITEGDKINDILIDALPGADAMNGAILRLTVEYPREFEGLIDAAALRKHTVPAFEFQLIRRPQSQSRIRLSIDQTVGNLSPLELLDKYWQAIHLDKPAQEETLQKLAESIILGQTGDTGGE